METSGLSRLIDMARDLKTGARARARPSGDPPTREGTRNDRSSHADGIRITLSAAARGSANAAELRAPDPAPPITTARPTETSTGSEWSRRDRAVAAYRQTAASDPGRHMDRRA